MARISAAGMDELHAKARKVLIKIPNITATELSRMFDIDIKTGCNILNDIRRENIEKINNEDIKDEIAKLQDSMRTVATELWAIIGNDETPKGAKIYALKTLSDITHRIHEAKLDAGIFKRHLGQVNVRPDFNLGELLKDAKPNERKQFIELAKSIIGDKRTAIEGSVISNGFAVSDSARDLQREPESEVRQLEIGSAA